METNFMLPSISVGIPFYNAANHLSDAIKSVISQTYPNWELILINDGSADDSLKIAQAYASQDNRIRVISDGLNKKLPARLNQIVAEAKYEYIARMDADDIMHPQRLEKQLSFLEDNKNYDLVSSGLISIDTCNHVKGFRGVNQLFDEFSVPRLSYPIVHPSIMARKSWYLRNHYSEMYPRAEDFELWTRTIINKDFKMAVLPDLLLFYREEGNLSLTKTLNSYRDIGKIHKVYYTNNKYNFEILKLKLKIFISKLFYYTGNFHRLASRRNQKFSDNDLIHYQGIINLIVQQAS